MKFSYEKFLEAKTGHPYLNVLIHPDDVPEFLLELDNHPEFLWAGMDKPSSFNPLETDIWKRSSLNDGKHYIYLQIKLGVYSGWSMTWDMCGGTILSFGLEHAISVYDLLEDEGDQSLKDIDITSLL